MASDATAGNNPVDWEVARRLTGGDDVLLKDLIEMFPVESAQHLAGVRQGIADDDAELVRRSAHSLKSAAGLFGAVTLVDRALQMETAGANATLAEARQQLAALEEETARVLAALETPP